MGNCCAAGAPEAEVNIAKSGTRYKTFKGDTKVLDEREVSGLRGTDKVILIIKIQSLIRGNQARKKVAQKHGFVTKSMPTGMIGEQNYENQTV